MTLERACEVFVRAFAATKSQPHPYIAELLDGMWVMRDAPGRKHARTIQAVACGPIPSRVVESIRRAGLGWHFLCDLAPVDVDLMGIRNAYKALGYRALATEWMFVHDLQRIPKLGCDPPVRLVGSQAEMGSIHQRVGQKRRLLPGSRQFVVADEIRDYGWVRSVPVEGDAWVSDLFVHEEVRRRGYGSALMSALLQADVKHGVAWSVLLSSSLGAKLYPGLGYRHLGTLQMFCPVQRP